ncbi:hypothetical protein ACTFIW_005439 [Dictyostelium discoideum]
MTEKVRSSGFALPEGIKDVNQLISNYMKLKEKEDKNILRKQELSKVKDELLIIKSEVNIYKQDREQKDKENKILYEENIKLKNSSFEIKNLNDKIENLEKQKIQLEEQLKEEKFNSEKLNEDNMKSEIIRKDLMNEKNELVEENTNITIFNKNLNIEKEKFKAEHEKLENVIRELRKQLENGDIEDEFSQAKVNNRGQIMDSPSEAGSFKSNGYGKINPNEFNGLIELFFTKGPDEFLNRIHWIFRKSKFNFDDIGHCELMVEYILHQIFSTIEEKRDICLNYGLIIGNYLKSNSGKVNWKDFKNLIIKNDDKLERKTLIQNQLKSHSANNYINEEGNGLQAHISVFENSSLYTDSLSSEERYIQFTKIKLQNNDTFDETPMTYWYDKAREEFKASKIMFNSLKEKEKVKQEFGTQKNKQNYQNNYTKQSNNGNNNSKQNNNPNNEMNEKKVEIKESNNNQQNETKKNEGSNGSFNCFKCGKQGHIARNCKN